MTDFADLITPACVGLLFLFIFILGTGSLLSKWRGE